MCETALHKRRDVWRPRERQKARDRRVISLSLSLSHRLCLPHSSVFLCLSPPYSILIQLIEFSVKFRMSMFTRPVHVDQNGEDRHLLQVKKHIYLLQCTNSPHYKCVSSEVTVVKWKRHCELWSTYTVLIDKRECLWMCALTPLCPWQNGATKNEPEKYAMIFVKFDLFCNSPTSDCSRTSS